MTYRGKVKDGAIVLDQPLLLPEGAEVLILPVEDDQTSIWRKLADLAGTGTGVQALGISPLTYLKWSIHEYFDESQTRLLMSLTHHLPV